MMALTILQNDNEQCTALWICVRLRCTKTLNILEHSLLLQSYKKTIRTNEINGTKENRTKGNTLNKRLSFNNT